ncbi:right-handed parallel beta-helix repeat-containing protein, partial [bacterium]|nr:right-handed parallel beta-helix repeat-containing protein [bacterium]
MSKRAVLIKRMSLAVFLTFLILSATNGYCATYYVSTTGDDNDDGLSQETAFRTIQKAADTVSAGDTVEVEAGTYTEAVSITTSGTYSNRIYFHAEEGAVIDAEDTRSYCIKLNNADYITIEGFECKNATGSGILLDIYANGNIITSNISHDNTDTGIKLNDSSYNQIISNTLYNNAGGSNAWGNRTCGIYVFAYSQYCTIQDNIVYDNQTGIWLECGSSYNSIEDNRSYSNTYNGFLFSESSYNYIENNISYENGSLGVGFGYSANYNSFKNNTVYGNYTTGVQLNVNSQNNIIKNNNIIANGTTSSSNRGILIESGSSADIDYNNVWNNGLNGGYNYGGVASAGAHDISANPLFKSTDPEEEDDYLKLSSKNNGDDNNSPCIDAGDPEDTPSAGSEPVIDMGAYDLYTMDGATVTYYVSPDGDDNDDGLSEETAFETITAAVNAVSPGDTVIVLPGTYEEAVFISNSGNQNTPTVFKAQGEAIIDAEDTRAYCIKLDNA